MKKMLMILISREMQIKTTTEMSFYLVRMTIIKKTLQNAFKDEKKGELSYIVSRDIITTVTCKTIPRVLKKKKKLF
jgi:hypothetical protein